VSKSYTQVSLIKLVDYLKGFLLLSLILLPLCLPSYFSISWTGTVVGYIVDEENSPVTGVRIEVWSGGLLITTSETDSNGYFSIDLDPGTYTLKFVKKGLEAYSVSVKVSPREVHNLGTITLKYAVQLTTVYKHIKVLPGSLLKIPLQLKNTGEEVEEATILVNCPEGWSYSIVYGDVEVKTITLEPGAKTTLNLCLEVGLTTGVYTVEITIVESSGYNYSRELSVEVTLKDVKVIEALEVFKEVRPGSLASFIFKLSNPFSIDILYSLKISKKAYWTTLLKYENTEVSQVFLKPGATANLKLEVYVPYSAQEGEYSFTVITYSTIVNQSAEVVLRVKRGIPILFLETSTPSLDVASGETAVYAIRVSNRGTRDTEVGFKLSGLPEEFKWFIKDTQGNTISKIFLKAGETTTVKLLVKPPVGYEPQYLSFTLEVLAENTTASLQLGVNVLGKYEIDYATENFYVEGFIGDTLVFGLEVVNSGHNDLTDIKVVLTKIPTDFNVTVEPESIAVLKPGEKAVFTVTVETPSDANAGDYYVFLKAVSDEDEAPLVSLHIYLRQKIETTLIAALAAVAVVVILVIVYKKYGRR